MFAYRMSSMLQDTSLRVYKRRGNSTARRKFIITNMCTVSKVCARLFMATLYASPCPEICWCWTPTPESVCVQVAEYRSVTAKSNLPLPSNLTYKWTLKLGMCNWNGTHQVYEGERHWAACKLFACRLAAYTWPD